MYDIEITSYNCKVIIDARFDNRNSLVTAIFLFHDNLLAIFYNTAKFTYEDFMPPLKKGTYCFGDVGRSVDRSVRR